jgi:hypothetical protein
MHVLVLALVLLISPPAFAKKYKELTEENVRSFVETATAMTTGNHELEPKEIKKYFEDHLTKDARFKSTIKYVLPGLPEKDAGIALDKEGFIDNIMKGADAFADHESFVEIKDVKIVSSGSQAIVATEGKESGVMVLPIADTGEFERIPVEGYTKCNQIIRLNKKGVIQIYNAVCDTLIEFNGGF